MAYNQSEKKIHDRVNDSFVERSSGLQSQICELGIAIDEQDGEKNKNYPFSVGTVVNGSVTSGNPEKYEEQRLAMMIGQPITNVRLSARNTSGFPLTVLLDKNLVNTSLDNPIYLRRHSKNALTQCLKLDTLFLANLFVMDYSLLVGLEDSPSGCHLVVGIIDYLRKFTFDKKLEMMIKQTLSSAGPKPTVLTPDLYRERFLEQTERYFHIVPDKWHESQVDRKQAWRI